jgi:hypothetical protein
MLLDGAIATLFNKKCVRPLLDRVEEVKTSICLRTGEGKEERAAAFRDAP